jgi:hypothetical protein
VNVRVARVATVGPSFRGEGSIWRYGSTPGPEGEKPATAVPGGRMGEESDVTWH